MPAEHLIGSNIARLRAERGLTQAELAESADLSRVSLGKIERGLVEPRSSTLADIARGLRVPLAELVTPTRPLRGVRFRVAKRVNTREQILAEVGIWLDAYNWLERELNQVVSFKLRALIKSGADPAKLARQVRTRLDLGEEPIRDICGVLEEAGVKVRQINKATDTFFGLSVSAEGDGPAVVVNTWERISVERWIFTAAHELGHILLHEEAYDRSRDQEDPEEEREADRFGGHLLLPAEGFRKEWDETSGLPFLDRVLKVKRMYRVSYKTVLHRLVENEWEKPSAWGKFQALYKARFNTTLRKASEPAGLSPHEFDWNRAGEPDRLSEYDFVQDRLYRLARVAYEREVISLGRAAEILAISHAEMRELADQWAP